MLGFRAIAQASKLEWVSLRCEVEGTLDRVERVTQFTAFSVRASLQVPRRNRRRAGARPAREGGEGLPDLELAQGAGRSSRRRSRSPASARQESRSRGGGRRAREPRSRSERIASSFSASAASSTMPGCSASPAALRSGGEVPPDFALLVDLRQASGCARDRGTACAAWSRSRSCSLRRLAARSSCRPIWASEWPACTRCCAKTRAGRDARLPRLRRAPGAG